ncbi:MAG: CvpA family protein, partial [Clostridia bacterium]|nr:CvpA family protein [Clostridia bacterium]
TFKDLDDVDGFKGWIANKVAEKLMDPSSEALNPSIDTARTSIAKTCVYNLASLIIALCLFILLCIGISLIFTLIKFATKGAHHSESTAVRVIDRTLGGIVGLFVGATIIFLVLAIITTVADKAPVIVEYIESSTICKFFYELNPIGKVFAKIFTKT